MWSVWSELFETLRELQTMNTFHEICFNPFVPKTIYCNWAFLWFRIKSQPIHLSIINSEFNQSFQYNIHYPDFGNPRTYPTGTITQWNIIISCTRPRRLVLRLRAFICISSVAFPKWKTWPTPSRLSLYVQNKMKSEYAFFISSLFHFNYQNVYRVESSTYKREILQRSHHACGRRLAFTMYAARSWTQTRKL